MVKEQVSICISDETVAQYSFRSCKFLMVQYKDTKSAFTAWKYQMTSSAFSSDAFQLVPHEQCNTTKLHVIMAATLSAVGEVKRKYLSTTKDNSFLHSMALQNMLHTTIAFLDLQCSCIIAWTTFLTALSQVFPNVDLHICWFFPLLHLHCQLKSQLISPASLEMYL